MDEKDLAYYRSEIAKLDDIIIDTLIQRFELTDKVGEYKKEHKIPIYNKKVEEELYLRLTQRGGKDIDPVLILNIYSLILEESKQRQIKIAKQ